MASVYLASPVSSRLDLSCKKEKQFTDTSQPLKQLGMEGGVGIGVGLLDDDY